MQLGLIGLGRMGMNMSRRLIQGGHEVVAYNRTPDRINEIVKEGAIVSIYPALRAARLRPVEDRHHV